jgi:predicted lipoprotein with Yx(FWY)xxD motif
MANYKAVAAAFIILTVVFAAAAGYLLAYPSSSTSTTTATTTVVTTASVGASPQYTVNIAYKSSIGFYLTNATGSTLYFRSTDTPNSGKTTCTTATCEKNWPVFYVTSLKLPPGLNSTDFNTITAYNSTKIVTYDGYPLFYWVSDTAAGTTTGQGIGGFYVCTVPTPKT